MSNDNKIYKLLATEEAINNIVAIFNGKSGAMIGYKNLRMDIDKIESDIKLVWSGVIDAAIGPIRIDLITLNFVQD